MTLRSPPKKVQTSATGKSYLVVGGHGLLGSHIVEALLARGERRVAVFDAAPSALFEAELARGDVVFHRGDIRDAQAVREACRGVDTVFHTVAAVNFWADLPFEYDAIHAVNVGGTENVVAACIAARVKQLLYASSAIVVLPHDVLDRPLLDVDERTPRAEAPFLCHYIATKALAEAAVLEADGKEGLRTAAIRPGGLFGPRDPRIIHQLAKGAPGIGLDTNVIEYVYVENVVHAFLVLESRLAEGEPTCGQAYFVGDDTSKRYSEFNRRFAAALGCPFELAPRWPITALAMSVQGLVRVSRGAASRVLGDLAMLRPASLALTRASYTFSHAKATTDFGYAPPYTFDEALAITVDHRARTTRQ